MLSVGDSFLSYSGTDARCCFGPLLRGWIAAVHLHYDCNGTTIPPFYVYILIFYVGCIKGARDTHTLANWETADANTVTVNRGKEEFRKMPPIRLEQRQSQLNSKNTPRDMFLIWRPRLQTVKHSEIVSFKDTA